MTLPRLLFLYLALTCTAAVAQDDVADIPSEKREVADNQRQAYYLIPAARATVPEAGYGLLVILPGGDGGEAFHPFVKRIRKHAVPDDFVVAQPISVKWTEKQQVVWPTDKLKVDKQKFSTEEFVEAVVADVATAASIDPKRVYCMGWSSSGPAVYALALRETSVVTGSYIAMSVYKPQQLPPLANARQRVIYIEHSREDRVCPFRMAQQGFQELKEAGAEITMVEYDGGHGWRGNVFGRIQAALTWLDSHRPGQ